MNKYCLVVLLAAAVTGLVKGETDEEIKQTIILSNCFVDDACAADRMFNRAVGMCGSDTNRLARLFYEISLTNEASLASSAVMRLGQYGTPAQLPYLYSVVTNKIRGAEAAKAILRIEGVTTNSILAVSNCLATITINAHERYLAFRDLVERVYQLGPDDACRSFGLGYVWQHAFTANAYCLGVDKELKNRDSTYNVSKRRLAVLRSVYALGLNDFQKQAVTNAINELVAYPEADLPE